MSNNFVVPFDVRLGDDKITKYFIININNKYPHICYAYSISMFKTATHN